MRQKMSVAKPASLLTQWLSKESFSTETATQHFDFSGMLLLPVYRSCIILDLHAQCLNSGVLSFLSLFLHPPFYLFIYLLILNLFWGH